MKKLFFLVLLVCSSSLFSKETYLCKYDKYAMFDIDTGDAAWKNTSFELDFVVTEKFKKGIIVGNNGSSDVQIIPIFKDEDFRGLTFLEITPIGNISTTTIDAKGNSVHSRNTVLSDGLIPSQYYGTCKLR